MSTNTAAHTGTSPALETRILNESYGPGAWHGPDLKAALAGVPADQAFWRPAPGRHNIAEIALHHAYCARNVRARLTGTAPEPFVLDGDDWFPLADERQLSWAKIQAVVDAEQRKLAEIIAGRVPGRGAAALPDAERFDLVLGITGHAIYHAGQVQLLKVLSAG